MMHEIYAHKNCMGRQIVPSDVNTAEHLLKQSKMFSVFTGTQKVDISFVLSIVRGTVSENFLEIFSQEHLQTLSCETSAKM